VSSGISFSGLGSGVDTNTIIAQLMSLERQPIRNIESDKAKVQSRQSVVQELNNLLKTLRDKAQVLKDAGAFSAKTASTTDATVASAIADSTAASGSYNVTVTALSKAHTMASAASPTMSDDTLHITVGSTTINVSALATDTLQGLADKINQATSTPVSASVVNSKLVLISKTTGAAGGMTVTSDAGLATALGMTTTQAAQDAAATVNGLSVTSSGNSISGAIAGVTLSLANAGSTVVNVGLDGKAIEGKVKEFVDAYNALIDNIQKATKYDIATKTKGTLQGDQTMTSFLGQLRGIAGAAVTSLSGAYDSLAQIGITTATDRSGKLVLNSATFQTALAASSAAVADVFGKDDGSGVADAGDGIAFQLYSLADSFSTDVMGGRLKGFTDQLGRMDKKIADLEVVMDLKEKNLRQKFAAMEKAVSTLRAQGSDLAARLGVA
jgi:flagellar hook-associated protein 2